MSPPSVEYPSVEWSAFVAADAALGAIATERIDGVGLCLVGTVRANGWPRISPVEPLVSGGRLYLGMMWQSKKALDLLRDPRCVVHSTVTDRGGSEGDVKVYGLATDVSDTDERDRYGVALHGRIGWRPDGDFHLFAVRVTEVGYFRVAGDDHTVRHWRPGRSRQGGLSTGPAHGTMTAP